MQAYHFLPIDQRRLILDECCLYSLKLLTIQVSSDGLTSFQKQFHLLSTKHIKKTVWVQGSLGLVWYRISRR
ncbi:unnamed protein product [Acanthoscelides obtectus]|uniref:Uncharacterized protein n=1 Tax=Acanthoscelides obtectus TaxID=200917 RepID=A0A9P0KWA9_ACAOB|nr:unnamed protein product [Acanthoscelides obtectus]